MDFNFLNKKVIKDTEERAADISTAQPSLDAEETTITEATPETALVDVTKTAAREIVESEASYKDKMRAAIDVAATAKALEDEKLRKVITDGKAEELKNISAASRIESKTEVIKRKTESEKSLYERYSYVYELFGIKKEIPNFYCVVVLSIYSVFGTLYAIFFGIPFMIVNLFIDSLAALFSKINGLTKNVWGGLKYTFMCVMVLLVFAIIGGGLYYLIHLMGIA